MVAEAVKQGKLWLTTGQASILAEEIPAGLSLTTRARTSSNSPRSTKTDGLWWMTQSAANHSPRANSLISRKKQGIPSILART
jgi:hypothetical protein